MLCTRCLAQGLTCDNSETCNNCVNCSKPCKRTMCNRYEGGDCIDRAFAFTHEGNGSTRLVPSTRIKGDQESKNGEGILQSREPRQKSIRGKKREAQHRYDKLFGHIASKKKRDRDDEDHSMATARSSKISQTRYSYAHVLRHL